MKLKVVLGLLGLGGLAALLHSIFSGSKVQDEPVEPEKTARDEALDEKRKIMAEMGRKGGKASAQKRKLKKESKVDGVQGQETHG